MCLRLTTKVRILQHKLSDIPENSSIVRVANSTDKLPDVHALRARHTSTRAQEQELEKSKTGLCLISKFLKDDATKLSYQVVGRSKTDLCHDSYVTNALFTSPPCALPSLPLLRLLAGRSMPAGLPTRSLALKALRRRLASPGEHFRASIFSAIG